MKQREIILTFVLAMTVYVLTVFLWPSSIGTADKTARLAGPSEETAFLKERFGVPGEENVVRME
ncbi:MAG TPA: hypothetical protein VHG11_01230 [Pseudorhizobium sp.]|nr:hypothetical protein [Pseudorhizobium sp.]